MWSEGVATQSLHVISKIGKKSADSHLYRGVCNKHLHLLPMGNHWF